MNYADRRQGKKERDVTFLIGFETEVIFLEDGIYPPLAISDHAWSASSSMRSSSVGKAIIEEIYDVLTDAGIDVQQLHAESAPGQYEVVTGPLPPVEAVDALVFTRDTIYNVAAKHGARATLYPKVYSEACISLPLAKLIAGGTASHVHVSLKQDTPSLDAKIEEAPGLNILETEFIAGLMNHLQAISAFVMPTMASYERLMDGAWAVLTRISESNS
jgi:glutamine synthetase